MIEVLELLEEIKEKLEEIDEKIENFMGFFELSENLRRGSFST
jgi:tetrahydromethanopterin S-methyltransferase subunit G